MYIQFALPIQEANVLRIGVIKSDETGQNSSANLSHQLPLSGILAVSVIAAFSSAVDYMYKFHGLFSR